MSPLLALCAVVCAMPAVAEAQPAAEVSSSTKEAGVAELPENFEFIAFPIVAYTPETNVLFAGAGLFFFDLSDDPNGKRSDVMASGAYSLNGQAAVQVKPNLYFGDGTTHVGAEFVVLDWPTQFYGYGEDSGQEMEIYNNQTFETELVLDWEFIDDFYAGFAYEFAVNSLRVDPDSEMLGPGVPGIDGGILSGVGLRSKYDTRDTRFATTQGQHVALEATYFNSLVKSDYDYWKVRFDARHFQSWGGHTLGLHAVTRITLGDPPIYDMSTIGGSNQLRGVFRGRFLDHGMYVLQTEYRTPYLWRVGLAGFAGVGDTFKHVADIEPEDIKWAAGGGVRFLLKEKERVNLRLDAGVSADDWGIYFGLSEAF